MAKRTIKNLEDLPAINFYGTRQAIEQILERIDNNFIRGTFCRIIGQHYKHLAQIDGIREDAKKEAEYFLNKAKEEYEK